MSTEKAQPVGRCWCGCGETTSEGRFFVQTHDGTALKYLRVLGFKRTPIADLILRAGFAPVTNRLKEAWERKKP